MTKLADLQTPHSPNWCPGCGDFAIWGAFKNAAVKQGWDNTNTALMAGIGCHGHILNFLKMASFEGLHGRALPAASGIKLANHKLNVFVFTGDGDCLGEGGNHFMHSCRRNHDLTVLLHDNQLYALTTGQASPVSPHGFKTKSTPAGNYEEPISPLALAIASGATFVARAYSGDIPKLTELIIQANAHKGFALIDILQPCVTFNKVCTHNFYQDNVYYLGEEHDPTNKAKAFIKAQEFAEKHIPLGIFYKKELPTFESNLPQLKENALVDIPLTNRSDISVLFKKYS
jgi:2-oxoglutarate/2-oxoacid ferredoxin oxidoreductase subunit beta